MRSCCLFFCRGERSGITGALALYRETGTLPDEYGLVKAAIAERGWDTNTQKVEGGERGTALHSCLEQYIKHDDIPHPHDWDKEVAPYVQSLAGFLLDYLPTFSASELTVFHAELEYAGTLDAFGTINKQPARKNAPWDLTGKRVIFDLKSNREARCYFHSINTS